MWSKASGRAAINRKLLQLYGSARTRLPEGRRQILFSRKAEWEEPIARSFRFTRYEIAFKELSETEILQHDLVVPLTIDALISLTDMRHLLADNPIPIPTIESINLCNDKFQFNKHLIRSGFSKFVPSIDVSRCPYILKKKIDEWGANSHIIKDARAERQFSEHIASPDYFRQEIVLGSKEYATHVIFKNGNVLCYRNIEYNFDCDMPIKGKDKFVSLEVCDCPYLDLFSSILNHIGLEGLCCFNYKLAHDRPYILEINPRFGGSLCPHFASFVEHLPWRDAELIATATQ